MRRPQGTACLPHRLFYTHLLLGGHTGEHLHVGDEAKQLLGVLGLQVGQAIAREAQRMLQGQRLWGALGQGQHNTAIDGAPLAGSACRAGAQGQREGFSKSPSSGPHLIRPSLISLKYPLGPHPSLALAIPVYTCTLDPRNPRRSQNLLL